MADNAAQSIKELQERLVSADKTLGEMIQRLDKYRIKNGLKPIHYKKWLEEQKQC